VDFAIFENIENKNIVKLARLWGSSKPDDEHTNIRKINLKI